MGRKQIYKDHAQRQAAYRCKRDGVIFEIIDGIVIFEKTGVTKKVTEKKTEKADSIDFELYKDLLGKLSNTIIEQKNNKDFVMIPASVTFEKVSKSCIEKGFITDYLERKNNKALRSFFDEAVDMFQEELNKIYNK